MTSAMLSAMLLRDLICKNRTPYVGLFAPNRHMPPLRLLRETGAVLKHYLRPTVPRCPHLGCALRYNRQERSWDCPCHGSRFTPEGKLIDAPAKQDVRSLQNKHTNQ
jgi:Rieske Fe-S protein